jgi:hypothetical protein
MRKGKAKINNNIIEDTFLKLLHLLYFYVSWTTSDCF